MLRHSFQPTNQTKNKTTKNCKPWHIYALAYCLSERRQKYGRDGTWGVVAVGAGTGCVEWRGWMDEREALHRLPHVMMLCFPSSSDCLTTSLPCPRPQPRACVCMLEGVGVVLAWRGWLGGRETKGKGRKKERSEGGQGTQAPPLTPHHTHTQPHRDTSSLLFIGEEGAK